MSRLSIYLLKDPETNEPKYIGITKRISILKKHPCIWGYQRNENRRNWLKDLVHKGLRPKIQFLQYVDPADAEWRRQMIIEHLNQLGWSLFNRTDDEAKHKRSERMRYLWSEAKYRRNNLLGKAKSLKPFLEIFTEKLKEVPAL